MESFSISQSSDLTAGSHSITRQPTFIDDESDYYLVAKIDSANVISETNENNNTRKFEGGIFRVTEPTKTVIHVHGSDSTDQLSAGSSGGSVTASSSQSLDSIDDARLKAGMAACNRGGVLAVRREPPGEWVRRGAQSRGFDRTACAVPLPR